MMADQMAEGSLHWEQWAAEQRDHRARNDTHLCEGTSVPSHYDWFMTEMKNSSLVLNIIATTLSSHASYDLLSSVSLPTHSYTTVVLWIFVFLDLWDMLVHLQDNTDLLHKNLFIMSKKLMLSVNCGAYQLGLKRTKQKWMWCLGSGLILRWTSENKVLNMSRLTKVKLRTG